MQTFDLERTDWDDLASGVHLSLSDDEDTDMDDMDDVDPDDDEDDW